MKEKDRLYFNDRKMRVQKDKHEIASRNMGLLEERDELKAIHKEREAMLIWLALYEA
jgi:hypothetical protein